MAEPRTPRKRRPVNAVRRHPIPDRYELFVNGTLDPADFTDEEVNRMQLMDKNGNFQGRPSKAIPRELAMAFRTEQQRRLVAWFAQSVPEAQKAYREILNSRHLQPGDAARLRAAEGIFERVIGKVAAQSDVHLTVDKGPSFEDFVGEALVEIEDDELGEIEE